MKMAPVVAALAGVLMAGSVAAQSWPTRPVTMVLPFGPGGATDAIARTLARHMSDGLGQQVVVENRAGAGGAIAASAVAKMPADGYTVLLGTVSTLVVLPLMQPDVAYNVSRDFIPVGLVARAPNVLLASPLLPANNVAELIAYAKANPGKLNFASSGQGTITHLIGELFKMQAGIDVLHIPYKTGVQAVAEMSTGQIHFMFDSIVWSLPQVQAGKLKGLGITSASRSTLAPAMSTVAESGLPGFEGLTWYALVAPSGTPEQPMERLRSALTAAQQDKAFAERIATMGAEPMAGGKAEFDTQIRQETAKWSKVVKSAGVKVQ